jgi:hypothetical protein
LIEVRCGGVLNAPDVALIDAEIGVFARRIGTKVVVCIDWRAVTVLAPDAVEALSDVMVKGSERVLCSAALLSPDGASFGLQVGRIFRPVRVAPRRAFYGIDELVHWLSKLATPQEAVRARRFLADGS